MKLLQFGGALQAVPGLRHAITTREDGVSSGEYGSLNLAFHVDDALSDVQQNRRLLADALDYDANHLIAAQQVHGTNAQIVTANDSGSGAFDWDGAIADCDALIVAQTNVPVLIQVADCAPILLVDPVNRALAVIHAGWRGAVGKITSHTLQKMQQEFGTKPQIVLAGIGPCLCPACFEVGGEVAIQAPPESVISGYSKPHLDLAAIISYDLAGVGVLPGQIETMSICPQCENDLLFSHRGQNGKAGRFGLVAWWQ
jgi:YfiH family protein